MAKIEAPNKDYNGPGPGGAIFKDGVGSTDDEAAINYYRSAGYAVDGDVEQPVEEQEPPDPRDYADETVGTRLRDAAVDPRPEDFLAPLNAGEANPHGPEVVSPEIHASGPSGVRPGEVFVEDPAKQEAREADYAKARLIERKPVGKVVAETVDLEDRGELEMSDPGSAEAGRQAASESATPSKNDNKAAWVDYAVAQGAERSEADSSTKAELIERYGA